MPNPLMQMIGGNSPMMQNNPIMQLVGALKNSNNPQQLLQQMANKNPQFQQIMQMTNGKSPQEMSEYVRNAAQQKGVDLSQLANQLGMPENVKKQLGIN